MELITRVAEVEDLDRLTVFLGQAGVYHEGIEPIINQYVVLADKKHELYGSLGFEKVGDDGLLRSLVISPRVNQGHILTLFQGILSLAKEQAVDHLYLVTNKSANMLFLQTVGFQPVDKHEVPEHLRKSNHYVQAVDMEHTMVMGLSLKSESMKKDRLFKK